MSSEQLFLVIGGTGKAGGHTVKSLKERGIADEQIRFATRNPKESNHVKFVWEDESTWDPVLKGVTAVLLIGAWSPNAVELIIKFVDKALAAGVKRQVLMSGLSLAIDGLFLGQAHRHVVDNVPEYVVFRPTHFNDNFLSGGYYDEMVKTGGQFSDGYADGKCGFIAAADIGAAVAAAFLLPSDSPLLNIEAGIQLEGPEALSFFEVADIMKKVSGKNIRYNDLDIDEMRANRPADFPEEIVKVLDFVLDVQRSGKMAPMKDQGVKKLTGREPKSFAVWAEENKDAWKDF